VDDVVAGVDDVVISSTLRRILVKALGALLLKQRLLISRQVVVVFSIHYSRATLLMCSSD
jgi:hypothetical protein